MNQITLDINGGKRVAQYDELASSRQDDLSEALNRSLTRLRDTNVATKKDGTSLETAKFGVLGLLAEQHQIKIYDHPSIKEAASSAKYFKSGGVGFIDADYLREKTKNGSSDEMLDLEVITVISKLFGSLENTATVPLPTRESSQKTNSSETISENELFSRLENQGLQKIAKNLKSIRQQTTQTSGKQTLKARNP